MSSYVFFVDSGCVGRILGRIDRILFLICFTFHLLQINTLGTSADLAVVLNSGRSVWVRCLPAEYGRVYARSEDIRTSLLEVFMLVEFCGFAVVIEDSTPATTFHISQTGS